MKKILLLCFSFVFASFTILAQDRVISGKVTSADDGASLPGVNVVLKGTTNGAVSDSDGNYKLSIPSSGGTLVFSFIGMLTKEEIVGDRSVVDVQLSSDVTQLSEIVVTALNIQRDPKTIGYSTSTVKGETINQARVTNLAAALSGKVSGLQINQTDNGVNGGVRIVLRGNRSFLGNNQALVVLDGVQVSSDYINSINPNDIENTTVLKGASAAALYGSQAANGVLIINTKRGINKTPEITISSTTQIEKVSYLPHLQTRFGMNGGETLGSPGNYNVDPNFVSPYTSYENQNYGPEFNGQIVPLGLPLADGSQQYVTYSPKYKEHLNFWDNATTQQTDGSFSVGDDKSSFYVSFQDVKKTGIVPKDEYRRDAFRVNGSKKYGNFKVAYNLQYTITNQNVNFAPGANRFNTVYWAWMNTGMNVPLTHYKDWKNDKFSSISGWYDEFYTNPYWLIDNNRRKVNNADFLGNVELSHQFTKWLNVLGRIGLQNRNAHQSDENARIDFDPAIVPPGSSRLSTPGVVPAGVNDTHGQQRRINADLLITYDQKFGDLRVTAIAGGNIQDDYSTFTNIGSANLLQLDPPIYNTNYRNGNLSGGMGTSRNRRLSAYGDLTLNWKFVTLHSSFRNDWVSLLAKNNRSFNYPSVDGAFEFTEAIPSLKDSKLITFGKIYASWSKVGNVSIGPYANQGVYQAGTPYSALGNVPVLYQSTSVISGNLQPEFTTQKEIGLEMGLWDSRINFKTAYYRANTTNQTVSFQTSRATGYANALINTGEMFNEGLEFDLSVTALTTSSGFKLNLGGNFTDLINNKVLSIYTSTTGDKLNSIQISDNGTAGNLLNAFAIVGQQYPVIQTNDWVRSPQGQVIIDPVTGLPSRNATLTNFGQGNPRYRLGLNATASYKGLSLYALFDYRSGNVIFNQLGSDIEFGGIGYTSAAAGRQRFVYPNSVIDNNDGTYTQNTNITINDGNYAFWQNRYNGVGGNYVTSAAFWKLREISLTYQLPTNILSYLKIVKAVKVSLTGRNLFMWRPKSNQWTDPEFSGDNSNSVGTTTAFQTPPTRIYGLNISATF